MGLQRQQQHNEAHGIEPMTIVKALPTMGVDTNDLLAGTSGKGIGGGRRFVGGFSGQTGKDSDERDLVKRFDLGAGAWAPGEDLVSRMSQPAWADVADTVLMDDLDSESGAVADRGRIIERLQKEMKAAAGRLDFERAASLRDRIFELQNETD